MSKTIQLKVAANYVEERTNLSSLNLHNFVTVDNLLQNKEGRIDASGLPPKGNSFPGYKPGDILIGNIRPYLKKIWFANCDGGSTQDVLILRANTGFDPKFLFYALFRDDFFVHMMNGKKGTKMPRGDKNQVLDFLVPDYDLPTQERIADVLSSLEAKIELNNRINAELEAMAKTLYDYWFVQFDFPDKNGKPYKSSGGKMVWNEQLKREIPAGWESGTLGDIADIVRGVTYDSTEIRCKTDSDVIPVLRATNISGNVIDLNDMVYVPKANVLSEQVLNKFDILIVMSSGSKEHIGKNAFFYYDQEVSFGAFCAKIVADNDYKFYLYSYTQSDFLFKTIKNECLGTNINNLNGTLVKGFKIAIPPKTLVKAFNKKVSSAYEKVGLNLIENQNLASIRDWLLPMLMNGQVKVMP